MELLIEEAGSGRDERGGRFEYDCLVSEEGRLRSHRGNDVYRDDG